MSVTVLNTTASLSGKTLLKAEDSQTITGAKTFDLGASAPFVVVSGAAKVANLDADKLDGQTGSYYNDAANLTGLVPNPSLTIEQTSSLTGAQNDVAPSAGAVVVIRCTGAAPAFTGFTGGVAGRILILECLGTTLKVSDQTGSSAANQIICPSVAGQIVGVNGSIVLAYDATTSRWRVVAVNPGKPIAVAFAAGNFTGNSLMTWTVASGDQITFTYQQIGKVVTVWLTLTGTTVGGTPNTLLQVALPNSFVATVQADQVCMLIDSGTPALAWGNVPVGGNAILISRQDSAAMTAAVDTTQVRGVFTFEVN